jgi:hypothetical protein
MSLPKDIGRCWRLLTYPSKDSAVYCVWNWNIQIVLALSVLRMVFNCMVTICLPASWWCLTALQHCYFIKKKTRSPPPPPPGIWSGPSSTTVYVIYMNQVFLNQLSSMVYHLELCTGDANVTMLWRFTGRECCIRNWNTQIEPVKWQHQ